MTLPRKKLLYVAQIWPELGASAASTRALELLDSFYQQDYRVAIICDAREQAATAALESLGYECQRIRHNDSECERFAESYAPDCVLMDRYTTEEKFSFRLRAVAPQALFLLDTIDLHALRLSREQCLKKDAQVNPDILTLLAQAPELWQRELAAIYRSDLSLVVSDYEYQLLTETLHVPASLLFLARLSYGEPPTVPGFHERQAMVMLGSFRHPPNVDSVIYTKEKLWPKIRQRLPQAELFIYGSYPEAKHLAWSDPKQGFWVKGQLAELGPTLSKALLHLAPLRYGAGIKGKIADACYYGTPSITSSLGAEGMIEGDFASLAIADEDDWFVDLVCLYAQDAELWQRLSTNAQNLIRRLYQRQLWEGPLHQKLDDISQQLSRHRLLHPFSAILWREQHRSTEYFSRWIESKNQRQKALSPPDP